MKGSVIQLGNGDIKNVEDLQTEDFVRSAYSSPNFVLEYSRLTRLEHCPGSGRFCPELLHGVGSCLCGIWPGRV